MVAAPLKAPFTAPEPAGSVEPIAVRVTYLAAVFGGASAAIAYVVLRLVGVDAHPMYLYAVLASMVAVVALHTRAQKVAVYGLVATMAALSVSAALGERFVYQPGLPILVLALAFAGVAWPPRATLAATLAELVAVAGIFLADRAAGTSAAHGLDPVRAYAVLTVAIACGGVLFSVTGAALRRTRREAEHEARRAREELARREEAEARLQRSARLEALGRLAGGIAHDFNNLLTAVASNLESVRPLASSGAGGSQAMAERIEAALQAVGRGARLTRQLLAYTRKQTFHVVAVDVRGLLDSMLPLVRRAAGESIVVAVSVDPNTFACKADPGQLEAAILNLVINAHDAMPDGGEVVIDVRPVLVASGDVGGRLRPGEYVAVTVTDDGVGMDARTLERATEPFFTTKKDGQGTGLGLAMVQGFVQRAGGTFELESTPGVGTTARLYLPRAEGLELSADAPDGSGTRRHFGRGKMVLVVEDDPDVREASIALFDAMGFRPVPAVSAAAAKDMLERYEPALLFSDVVLPGGMDGVALARWARQRRPDLPVLLTSGYTGDDAGTIEDFPIIHKPFRAKELRARLRELLPDLAA
ncbi:MAG: response regulator [Deltaproteobacteria bacterium]|nr:MAG: response regulator [Deltaproteobacteria bacterium]